MIKRFVLVLALVMLPSAAMAQQHDHAKKEALAVKMDEHHKKMGDHHAARTDAKARATAVKAESTMDKCEHVKDAKKAEHKHE